MKTSRIPSCTAIALVMSALAATNCGGPGADDDHASDPVATTKSADSTLQLIALQGPFDDTQYVSATNGGGGEVWDTAPAVGPWEVFNLVYPDPVNHPNNVALQTFTTGNYLTAVNGGGGSVYATSTTIGPNETFVMEHGYVAPQYTFKTAAGYYLQADNGGGAGVSAEGTNPSCNDDSCPQLAVIPMPSQTPPQIAAAIDPNNSTLNVVGANNYESPYLASWLDPYSGWQAGGFLPAPGGVLSSFALHLGWQGNLQLVGISASTGRPVLEAYLTNGEYDPVWVLGESLPVNLPSGVRLTNTVLQWGANAEFWAFSIGTDGRVYVAAEQVGNGTATGQWLAYQNSFDGTSALPSNLPSGVTITSIAAASGNGNNTQVVGVGSDGKVYLVAYEDLGGWHAYGALPSGVPSGVTPTSLALGKGNGGNLQVVAEGSDGQLYLVSWQNASTGAWTAGFMLDTNLAITSLVTGNSQSGELQVLGIDPSGGLDLGNWQDNGGGWHAFEPLPSSVPSGVTLQALATSPDAWGNLDVTGVASDGHFYLVAWQDHSTGNWNAGQLLH